MEDNTRNFKSFPSYNQIINGQLVNSVHVRIFNPLDTIVSNHYEELLATDGKTIKKRYNSNRKHISGYSFVVISSGIRERFPASSHYLYIKVYLTDDFDIAKLDGENFLGKAYVVEAIRKYLCYEEPVLSPLQNYLRKKKVGAGYEDFYNHLKDLASTFEFDKVEELFEAYKISSKYQALFWKEMYQEMAKKEALL